MQYIALLRWDNTAVQKLPNNNFYSIEAKVLSFILYLAVGYKNTCGNCLFNNFKISSFQIHFIIFTFSFNFIILVLNWYCSVQSVIASTWIVDKTKYPKVRGSMHSGVTCKTNNENKHYLKIGNWTGLTRIILNVKQRNIGTILERYIISRINKSFFFLFIIYSIHIFAIYVYVSVISGCLFPGKTYTQFVTKRS